MLTKALIAKSQTANRKADCLNAKSHCLIAKPQTAIRKGQGKYGGWRIVDHKANLSHPLPLLATPLCVLCPHPPLPPSLSLLPNPSGVTHFEASSSAGGGHVEEFVSLVECARAVEEAGKALSGRVDLNLARTLSLRL